MKPNATSIELLETTIAFSYQNSKPNSELIVGL